MNEIQALKNGWLRMMLANWASVTLNELDIDLYDFKKQQGVLASVLSSVASVFPNSNIRVHDSKTGKDRKLKAREIAPSALTTARALLGRGGPRDPWKDGFSVYANPAVRPGPSLASEPGWLYHATNEERMAEIAVEGLKPHRPWEFTDQETWPDGATEKRIYFSPKAEIVWQFAPEKGGAVILRVPKSAVAWRTEGTGDVYVTKKIPPEWIQVLWNDGWREVSDA